MSLPEDGVKKLVNKAGVDNISPAAVKELQKAVEEIGLEVAKEAASLARKAGRKSITTEDVFTASGKQKA